MTMVQATGPERPNSSCTFLAVVPALSKPEAIANVRTALNNGAKGVFLTNDGLFPEELNEIYDGVRPNFPDAWLGVS